MHTQPTQHNTCGAYIMPLEACVPPYRRWPRTTRRASCLSINPLADQRTLPAFHGYGIVLSF